MIEKTCGEMESLASRDFEGGIDRDSITVYFNRAPTAAELKALEEMMRKADDWITQQQWDDHYAEQNRRYKEL